jgi:hypothetical protein
MQNIPAEILVCKKHLSMTEIWFVPAVYLVPIIELVGNIVTYRPTIAIVTFYLC